MRQEPRSTSRLAFLDSVLKLDAACCSNRGRVEEAILPRGTQLVKKSNGPAEACATSAPRRLTSPVSQRRLSATAPALSLSVRPDGEAPRPGGSQEPLAGRARTASRRTAVAGARAASDVILCTPSPRSSSKSTVCPTCNPPRCDRSSSFQFTHTIYVSIPGRTGTHGDSSSHPYSEVLPEPRFYFLSASVQQPWSH